MGKCRSSVTPSRTMQQAPSPRAVANPTTLARRISTKPVSVAVVMTTLLLDAQTHPRRGLPEQQASSQPARPHDRRAIGAARRRRGEKQGVLQFLLALLGLGGLPGHD